MSIGRIIAREWLYLLGGAVVGGIVALLVFLILKPTETELAKRSSWTRHPDSDFRTAEEEKDAVFYWCPREEAESLADQWEDSSISVNIYERAVGMAVSKERAATSEKNSLFWGQMVYTQMKSLATERYFEALRASNEYESKVRIATNGAKVSFFFPYPIFLFVRSIVWAIRKVKSKEKIPNKGESA